MASATVTLDPQCPAALRIEGLAKAFPGVQALDEVDFTVDHGSVHALLGHNGSGKSTLIKVLAGFHKPDAGTAWVDGELLPLGDAVAAHHAGVRFVHQDLALIPELNAIDNVALDVGYRRRRVGTVAWRAQRELTLELLDRIGIDIDIDRPLAVAPAVERLAVAVARALNGWQAGRGLLVFDEPTAALARAEVEHLFTLIRNVRGTGTAVMLVSHRLDEVLGIADHATVLRKGQAVWTGEAGGISARRLAELIVGHDIDTGSGASSAPPDASPGPAVMTVRNLHSGRIAGIDLELHAGEVLGIAGLLGSGREELPYAVAGAVAATGTWTIGETCRDTLNPHAAMELGIGFVPAERGREGLIKEFSVGKNLTLAALPGLRRWKLITERAERPFADRWLQRLGVRPETVSQPAGILSGGNQQRVLIGRCLAVAPRVLVLAEPTAGVDVGAREALYEQVRALTTDGLAVLVASSDLGDLLAICTRVAVIRDGHIRTELHGDAITEAAIIEAMENS